MRAVRSIRDAEIIIGQLLDRVTVLENAVKQKLAVGSVQPQTSDSDIESRDAILSADGNLIVHRLRHTFRDDILVNNVKVIGIQQSDPGAGPSSPSQTTLGIGGSAGATYTSNEQTLINNLLTNNTNTNTNVFNLKTAVDALIVCVNNIRTALRNHGLCA